MMEEGDGVPEKEGKEKIYYSKDKKSLQKYKLS
jgi:hypothetical protein